MSQLAIAPILSQAAFTALELAAVTELSASTASDNGTSAPMPGATS